MSQNKMPKIEWNLKTILTILTVIVVIYLFISGKIPIGGGEEGGSSNDSVPVVTQQDQTAATKPAATTPAAASQAATKPAATEKAYTAYYFRSSKLLNEHYDKHGKEMGFKSAKDYEKAASDVINNPDALTKREKEDNDFVFYVLETNEFVILSQDGYIRTYFLPNAGKAYYDRQ